MTDHAAAVAIEIAATERELGIEGPRLARTAHSLRQGDLVVVVGGEA